MKNEKKILEERIYREEYSIRKEIDNGIEKCFITFFGVVDDVEVEITSDDYKLYKSAFSKPLTKHDNDLRRKIDGRTFEMLEKLQIYNQKTKDIADVFLVKAELLDVQKIVETCTYTQQKRFNLHFYYGYTFTQIANLENCSRISVKESIDIVLEKLQKNN